VVIDRPLLPRLPRLLSTLLYHPHSQDPPHTPVIRLALHTTATVPLCPPARLLHSRAVSFFGKIRGEYQYLLLPAPSAAPHPFNKAI
jgi:hypothetical protein